jgi:hypothetical protein
MHVDKFKSWLKDKLGDEISIIKEHYGNQNDTYKIVVFKGGVKQIYFLKIGKSLYEERKKIIWI